MKIWIALALVCALAIGQASAGGKEIVAAVRAQIGTPYSWGGGGWRGKSRGIGEGAHTVGFDCSGLAQYGVYHGTKKIIARVASAQYHDAKCKHVPYAQHQPGDLVFFNDGGSIHHVAIISGHNMMIQAPHTGDHVREGPVYTKGRMNLVQRCCDFEIKVEGKSIHVHKSHLQMASEYLRAMVSEYWCDKSEVEITDYPYEVVYRYLKYLYAGQIEITVDIIEKLYDLANCYVEKDLMERCEGFMSEQIEKLTPESLPLYYHLATQYGCDALKVKIETDCMQRLAEMYPAAVQANLIELKDRLEVYMCANINSTTCHTIWSLATRYNLDAVKNAAEMFFVSDVNNFGSYYRGGPEWNKNRQYDFYYRIASEHQMNQLEETLVSSLVVSFREWSLANHLTGLNTDQRNRLVNLMLDAM